MKPIITPAPRRMLLRPAAGLLLSALLCACSQAGPSVAAIEPGEDTACVLDGMMLLQFAGPKAQIHYAQGPVEFYCDLLEMFSALLAPEQKRGTATVFVQDMGKTGWDHPHANWIDARTAIYVTGSRKRGSMGPTFGSFSNMADAQLFARNEGGKLLRFEQITPDMVSLRGGVVDDTTMSR